MAADELEQPNLVGASGKPRAAVGSLDSYAMGSWLFGRRRAEPVPLVLYTRERCGLCEEMKAEIHAARVRFPWTLTEVDIDASTELQSAYGQSIPVLWIAGRKAFKGRMSGVEFVRKFERMAQDWYRARELERVLERRADPPGTRAGTQAPHAIPKRDAK